MKKVLRADTPYARKVWARVAEVAKQSPSWADPLNLRKETDED